MKTTTPKAPRLRSPTRWQRHPRAGLARLARATALGCAFALALASGACQVAGQVLNRSNPAENLQGRIVWPKDGDLWTFDLATKQQQKITSLPSGAAVTGASWSPDGTRVVFAEFSRRPNERQSGADLMIANADGSDAHLFAERDAANSVL